MQVKLSRSKRTGFSARCFLLASSFSLFTSMVVQADLPGAHPGIEHMQSDLRMAIWLLTPRSSDSAATKALETAAINKITATLTSASSIVPDISANAKMPSTNTKLTQQQRIQRAIFFIQQAQHELDGEVDRADLRTAISALKGQLVTVNQSATSVATAVGQ